MVERVPRLNSRYRSSGKFPEVQERMGKGGEN